jgi:hypothetical protein
MSLQKASLSTEVRSKVLSGLAPTSIACAGMKPTRGHAASKMASTVTVLRR